MAELRLITDPGELPDDIDITDRIRLLQFLPTGSFELIVFQKVEDDIYDPYGNGKTKHRACHIPIVMVDGVVKDTLGRWFVCTSDLIPRSGNTIPIRDIISALRISVDVRTFSGTESTGPR